MEAVRIWVFPGIALLGALILFMVEWRVLAAERRLGHPRWARFVRRMMGAGSIAAIGLMLHFSVLPTKVTAQDVAPITAYWMTIVGLALFAILLALWDVVDSIRALRHQLDTEAHGEIDALRRQIRSEGDTHLDGGPGRKARG